jgi:hypothetical protein
MPDCDCPDAVSGSRNSQFLEITALISVDTEEESTPSSFFDEKEKILRDHAGVDDPIRRVPLRSVIESHLPLVIE